MSSSGALEGADRPLVPVICGPTGAGKSAVAMRLAQRFGGTIISADSRQLYRRFDVGTAKPTPADRARVPHLGIDLIEPTERYSAAAWADAAERWIGETEERGGHPLVVGGTGFYLRALCEPLFEEPALEPGRRQALESELASRSLADLTRWTRVLDPERAKLGRTQLLRAIEIALLTGRRLSDLHRERARPARRTARYLVVDPGEALATQILDRIDAMLRGGWVEEVRSLMQTVPDNAPAWKSTGYRVVRRLARGEISLAAAREAIHVETRQYAKRQRTWFRTQLPEASVTRLDPRAADADDVTSRWWQAVTGKREVAR
jgi:tRNA dimethylallyltransferase